MIVGTVGVSLCFIATGLNLGAWWGWRRETRRMRADRENTRVMFLAELADETRVTPLQVQTALDAAMATFAQRITEMGGRP
jgi:hypothetical protein